MKKNPDNLTIASRVFGNTQMTLSVASMMLTLVLLITNRLKHVK